MKNLLKFYALGLSVLMISNGIKAQVRQTNRGLTSSSTFQARLNHTLLWEEPTTEVKYDGSARTYLFFKGAVFLGEKSLPYFIENNKVSSNTTTQVRLEDLRFEPLSSKEKEAVMGISFASSIEVATERYTEMKQDYVRISFVPIRKNGTTGQLEKLVGFNLKKTQKPYGRPKAATASNATTSVLSTGNWYKLGIGQDGLYRVTYSDLEAMGMDVNSIDPRRLNVYGNGGGMLPHANSAFRHDDLQQNAIEVVGEADGSFDTGDYIVFYAKGPHSWVQDSTSCGLFRHEYNVYSDEAYYFITVDRGMGRRIASVNSANGVANKTVTSFTDHQFHEADDVNLIKTGREWFGEVFDIQTSYSFDFGFSNVLPGEVGYVSTKFLARHSSATTFSVKVNGNTAVNGESIAGTSGVYAATAVAKTTCSEVQLASGNTSVAITYNKSGVPSAVGWLDYIDVIVKRSLSMAGGQMAFRNLESVGAGNISEFQLSNANSSVRIWEITDPTNVSQRSLNQQGSVASFKVETDSLRQFIAFNGGAFYTVNPIGQIENQNLHALSQANMVIVCHPNFLSEAERLATFHQESETNPLSVHIVTPQQIYNEFSSGAQDISAIRDFMRMFYNRSISWEDYPRYLLLFGDASYDYKDRLPENTNYVPTYESVQSLSPTITYASDDYFGLLDPDEGAWTSTDALDVGIGRFVARTIEDARVLVDKIYRYEQLGTPELDAAALAACADGTATITSPDWRNRIAFMADDEDNNLHLNQADQLANLIDTMYPEYNLTKIYFDAYVQESTPGGQRYPEANATMNAEVQRGALIFNYTGHGGELGLALERVLGISDINSWTNYSNLLVFVTATCEFTRYDDPSRISAGEIVHLNPNGGGIALFSTSRLVYSSPNFTLNRNFFLKLQTEQPWGPPTMGDIIRMTKVASGGGINNRNFSLFGDPAQRLASPLHDVETLTINGDDVNSLTDTISALQLVTVTGRMKNRNGQLMPDFNGVVYPTVFDKATNVTTLGNDPGSPPRAFSVQKNLIYKGKASVTNGEFRFTFVVPKDIAYTYDFGRISYYAEDNSTNASGYYEKFIIGGSSNNTSADKNGPEVNLFMNDEGFAYGGTTDESPSLLAVVSDTNGVNTVGNGIGHDITAVLDDNSTSTINLNDFYQADLDSYQSGKVVYPFNKLSEGTHTLKLKIWDVYNNSSEAYTEFVVSESAELALNHVLNYPNPFTTNTAFMFEHNQSCTSLDVQVQVFTVSGKLVKTINETVLSQGFRNDPIQWNGLDDYGQKIGRGVYLYNLKIKTPDGQTAEQIERLVILN